MAKIVEQNSSSSSSTLVGNGSVSSTVVNGNGTAYAGPGRGLITGGGGDDKLFGGAGDDVLQGNGGDDTLYGGTGDDILRGGAGKDTLWGAAGDDVLVGGGGSDVLHGGGGADIFRYLDLSEAPSERIVDFSQADGDKIDLFAIDARPGASGDQAFTFADGINYLVYQPGTVTTYQEKGDTFVSADTGKGVLTLKVEGSVTFTADDFIL